jgi:hypothetical protein
MGCRSVEAVRGSPGGRSPLDFGDPPRRIQSVRHRVQSSVALSALIVVSLALAIGGGCGSTDDRKPVRGRASGALFVQLLRPGEPLAVIDLPSGEPRLVRGLALMGGDPPVRIVRTGRRLVYYGAGGTYAIGLALKEKPQKLGDAWYFIPSATEGRVWLAFLDRESRATVRNLRAVAEVTVQGEVTARSAGPPPCRGPTVIAALEGALVCQGGGGLRVFDPGSGDVLIRLPGLFPLDTHARLLAWCGRQCPAVHITDIGTGGETVVEPGERFRFEETYEGAFSPDGALLAAPVLTGGYRRQVALIDVHEGVATVIAGSKLSGYRNITWSSSGRWLFFEAGRGRVMAYRRGSARATTLPFRLRDELLDLAAS